MANIKYIDGVAYKNINGVIHKLVGALWNNNNKLEKLGSFIYKDLLGRDQWIPIPDTNYTTIPLVKSMVDFNENRLANLISIDVTQVLLNAWKGLITETGVNYNGVLGFPNIPGIQFNLAKNGFLTNGTEYTVSIKPIGNYVFTGITSPEIKITPTQFTSPAKVLIITQGMKNQVITDLKYTGLNSKGTTIAGTYKDYTVIVDPAGGAQSNGDTIKLTLVGKNQTRLIGDVVIFHNIPANSFQNITHLTTAQIEARWFNTLRFTGYEGKGTITSPQTFPFGKAIITPKTALSNGQEVSIDMIPNKGYKIDDANQANGSFTGYKYNIPASTFVPEPATVISGAQEFDNVVNGIQFTSDGKPSTTYRSDHITVTFSPLTGNKVGDTVAVTIAYQNGYTWIDVSNPYTDGYTIVPGDISDKNTLARIRAADSTTINLGDYIYGHYILPNGNVVFYGRGSQSAEYTPDLVTQVRAADKTTIDLSGGNIYGHYVKPNGNVVFYGTSSTEYTPDLVTQVRTVDKTTIDLLGGEVYGHYVKLNGNVVFYATFSAEYTADLITQVRPADITTIDFSKKDEFNTVLGHYIKPNGNIVFYGALSTSTEYTPDLVTQVRAADKTTINLGNFIYGHYKKPNGNVVFHGDDSFSTEYTADLITQVRPADITTIDLGNREAILGHYELPNGHIVFYGTGSYSTEYALQ